MGLDDYERKRDFSQSPEPQGRQVRPKPQGRQKSLHQDATSDPAPGLRFVVQKHDARNLHFDFRLEHGGVLKSWAVPRGPSLNASVKRLAIEVEDHPLEYADFEGKIPEGHYGAGQVLVWDSGSWYPEGDVSKMLQSGKLKFRLEGQRLRGDWMLIRTGLKGKQQQWLLSKRDDDEARSDVDVVKTFTDSVLAQASPAPPTSLPDFIPPKLPTWSSDVPRGEGWVHELKMDGYRMQAQWRSDCFRLMTRSGHDWTHRYPAIASELSKLDLVGTIIDGELTALDEVGKSNFDLLQQYRSGSRAQALNDKDSQNSRDKLHRSEIALAFFAFDLLYMRGLDLRDRPLLERKAALKSIVVTKQGNSLSPRLQYLDYLTSGVDTLIHQCQSLGLEGIVSKRVDRKYASGRAGDWLKTKFRYREVLIIVGFETTLKSSALSSLLVAYYDDNEQLQFAGRVGTGWSEKRAEQIVERLMKLLLDSSPLVTKLTLSKRGSEGDVNLFWVQPIVLAGVEFATWTEARQLRHATFSGFDDEASPREVTAAQLFRSEGVEVAKNPKTRRNQPDSATFKNSKTELLGLSNPDRVLFERDQITKADVATYLYQVNQWLLPHVRSRPVSLLRCSDGIENESFFQRHPGKGFPPEIELFSVDTEKEPLLTIDTLSALLATAQISAIELHPWGCCTDDMERPDRMIMDLDPDVNLSWNVVVEAAFIVRAELESRGLQSFIKTTGGKGLHVVVPLSRKGNWDEVFEFSKTLATHLSKKNPTLFVANMSKSCRKAHIYLDYHRNRRGSTAVAAYSLRARSGAPVATPITWDELPLIQPSQFTLQTVPQRLARMANDPWKGMDSVEQSWL